MACSKSRGSLMREIKNLMRRPLEDITIEVNAHNLSILTAYILGPEGTPFEQGRFRIELQFPDSYPQQPPKGFFKTKIWHPNVLWNGGDICVDTLKRGWNEKMGVRDILIAVRSLMIVPNYDSALNGEAGKQIISSYEEFEAIARQKTDFYAESAETYRKVKFLPFCILRECIVSFHWFCTRNFKNWRCFHFVIRQREHCKVIATAATDRKDSTEMTCSPRPKRTTPRNPMSLQQTQWTPWRRNMEIQREKRMTSGMQRRNTNQRTNRRNPKGKSRSTNRNYRNRWADIDCCLSEREWEWTFFERWYLSLHSIFCCFLLWGLDWWVYKLVKTPSVRQCVCLYFCISFIRFILLFINSSYFINLDFLARKATSNCGWTNLKQKTEYMSVNHWHSVITNTHATRKYISTFNLNLRDTKHTWPKTGQINSLSHSRRSPWAHKWLCLPIHAIICPLHSFAAL